MINTVYFEKGSNFANIYNLYQWDYGQSLEIKGLDIHDNVWVQFAMNPYGGEAIPVVTKVNDGVITANIPAFVFEKETYQNYNAYAFVYVSNADSGETVKVIKLNIKARPKPEDYVYTEPEKQRYEIIENLIKSFLNSNGEIDPKKIPDMYYKKDGIVNTIKEEYLGLDWVPKIRVNNVEIFKEQKITVTNENNVGNKELYLYDLGIDQDTRKKIINEYDSLTLVVDGITIELPYVKKFEEDGYVNEAIFTQEPYSVAGNNLTGSVLVGAGKNATMQVALTLGEHTLEVRHINVTPNPLPAELLTDGTPYLEETFSEILPEMTAETSDLYGGEMRLPIGLELFEGDEYNVKWQGKEYDCKCFSIEIDGVKINVLGDAYTLSGGEVGKEATGEPFCFFIYPKELQGVINASGSCTPVPHVSNETFTFSIDGYKKKLRKLPEECLPDSIKELLNGSLPNIKVDSELSKTSTNPVQNKVVAEAVEKLSKEIVDKIPSKEVTGTILTISDAVKGKPILCECESPITVKGINLCDTRNAKFVKAREITLPTTLPAGTYTLSAYCTTEAEVARTIVRFGNGNSYISGYFGPLNTGERAKATITTTDDFSSIMLYSSGGAVASEGYSAEYTDMILTIGKSDEPVAYEKYVGTTVYENVKDLVLTDETNVLTADSEINIKYAVKSDYLSSVLSGIKNENEDGKLELTYYVTPEMFGAIADGECDDTSAIQSAIDNANGKVVVLCGTYKVDNVIVINKPVSVKMYGTITYYGTGTCIRIEVNREVYPNNRMTGVQITGKGIIRVKNEEFDGSLISIGSGVSNAEIELSLYAYSYKTCKGIAVSCITDTYNDYVGESKSAIYNNNIDIYAEGFLYGIYAEGVSSWINSNKFGGIIEYCTYGVYLKNNGQMVGSNFIDVRGEAGKYREEHPYGCGVYVGKNCDNQYIVFGMIDINRDGFNKYAVILKSENNTVVHNINGGIRYFLNHNRNNYISGSSIIELDTDKSYIKDLSDEYYTIESIGEVSFIDDTDLFSYGNLGTKKGRLQYSLADTTNDGIRITIDLSSHPMCLNVCKILCSYPSGSPAHVKMTITGMDGYNQIINETSDIYDLRNNDIALSNYFNLTLLYKVSKIELELIGTSEPEKASSVVVDYIGIGGKNIYSPFYESGLNEVTES